jgi:hypothetical protein
MSYRESLRIVRIRHTLRELTAVRGSAPEIERALDDLRRAAADRPLACDELRREYERWCVRLQSAVDATLGSAPVPH